MRRAVGMISRYWPKGWTAERTDAYQRVLNEFQAVTVAKAIDRLGDEWRGIEAPPVAYIAEECRKAERKGRDDLPDVDRRVIYRPCSRCHTPRTTLLPERLVYCQACNTVQLAGKTQSGEPRITFTNAEIAQLER